MIAFRLRARLPTLLALPVCLSAFCAPSAFAQAFTAADSGWVRLFNGTDFDGFYSRTYNQNGVNAAKVVPPGQPYSIEYAGTDTAAIRVGSTSSSLQGNIGTLDTTFSHYRLRWEMKHDAVNANSNAGLTYHTDESAIRMQNNWPRSIEFQGKQNEAGSAFSIQQVAFTTRASGTGQGSNYASSGGTIVQACEIGCNGRWYKGSPLIQPYEAGSPNVTRWMRFHLVVRGADSAIHIVNDTTVMRLWNIRIFNDSTRNTGSASSGQNSASNKTPNGPWDHGGLTWQSEGALVRYRRIEVMRIPPSTPMNEHFLHRLFLDYPYGKVYTVDAPFRWRSIGTIPFVRIERRVQGGSWTLLVDSLPNTGSYDMGPNANCASPACMVDFRISSVDYVASDSTVGRVTALRTGSPAHGTLTFSVPGQGVILSGLGSGTRVEIRDAGGALVRELLLGEGGLSWDLLDALGRRAPPGMYFLRAVKDGAAYRTGRVLVL